MKYFVFFASVFLSGCATVTDCQPVMVDKVVSVPCITSVPASPELSSVKLPDSASLAEQIQAISIDILLLKAHNNELMAVVEACR